MPKLTKGMKQLAGYIPKPNGLREMYQRYMKARGYSSEDLGKLLGTSGDNIRQKMRKGVWTSEQIKQWNKALGITDAEEIGRAIMYGG